MSKDFANSNYDDILRWKNGSDILIEFTNGLILEYRNIEDPCSVVKDLVDRYAPNEGLSELDIIKNHLSEIWIKRNTCNSAYKKIWDNKMSNELPFHILEGYNQNLYLRFLSFFMEHRSFAKIYLSMYFPFQYTFLIKNLDKIELGDAHYTVYINDVETIYRSQFGLSYNKNIRWNSRLRAKYSYGLFNPYMGAYVGTDTGVVSVDEIDFKDVMIPLSVEKEVDSWIREYRFWFFDHLDVFEIEDYNDGIDEYEISKNFEHIGYDDFIELFKNPLYVLLNSSIWKNTLKYIIDDDFCYVVLLSD
jgi:hypothetical protein